MNKIIGNKSVYIRCKQALFSLLRKMDFDSVGIKDIASECGFSRQYFYRFYSDKFELVYDIVEESFFLSGDIFVFERSMPELLSEIKQNAFAYRKIMQSSYFFDLYRLFIIAEKASAIVLAESAFMRKFTPEQEYTLDFLFHGMTSVLFEGIMTGKKVDEIELTQRLLKGLPDDLKYLFNEEVTVAQITYKIRKMYYEK